MRRLHFLIDEVEPTISDVFHSVFQWHREKKSFCQQISILPMKIDFVDSLFKKEKKTKINN